MQVQFMNNIESTLSSPINRNLFYSAFYLEIIKCVVARINNNEIHVNVTREDENHTPIQYGSILF